MLWGLKNLFQRRDPPPRPDRLPLLHVPDVQGKTFVFICGLHRSGTSLLHRLLRDHPAISGFANTGVPEDEGQHLQTVLPRDQDLGGVGRIAFAANGHLSEVPLEKALPIRNALLGQWCRHHDLRKPVLVEKSPPNILRSRLLQSAFPGARFLFIVRHPIPASLSTQKWKSKLSLAELLRHWDTAHKIMLTDLPHLEHSLVVRYEDLVADPGATLGQIWLWLQIEQYEPLEAVADRNADPLREWADTLCEDDGHAGFPDNSAGAPSSVFGYSLSPPFVRARDAGGSTLNDLQATARTKAIPAQ